MILAGDALELLLVVDDEEGMRETLADILEEYDLVVDVACNGREAVVKVETRDYLLVIMDIRMPVMTGTEALALIAATCPDLPVIMMTAFADSAALAEVKKHGARALLRKPLDLPELIQLVQRIVQERLTLMARIPCE